MTAASVDGIPPLADRRLADLVLRQAAARPSQPYVTFAATGSTWTYAEFADQAARFAGGLRALGHSIGDRIGIMLPNDPEYLLGWFGSLFAGTVDVAVNSALTKGRLAHQLRVAGVTTLICRADGARAVAEVCRDLPSLKRIVSVGDGVPDLGLEHLSFDSLLTSPPAERYPSSPKDTATIRYTSGTTGPAKAVALTHSRLTVFANQFVWLTGYTAEDALYTCFPLHHGIASTLGVVTTLVSGGHLIVDDRFSASGYWDSIRRHDATLAHIINPLLPILLAQPPSSHDRDHRCARLWTAVPNEQFESRFRTQLINFYGQSEGGAIAVIPPGEEAPQGSSGRESDLFEIQIVDDDDYPVTAGEVGEIVWRPKQPHLMTPGYVGDPESTVRAWQNLWFHSGDAGKLDADGYLFLIGRQGDQIRRKGVNISAEEVEAAASEYGPVVIAAAVAVPSELGESEVKLCVVADSADFDPAALHTHLREALPPEMVPRFIEVRDSLPLTDTHKVRKAVLRGEGVTASVIDFEAHRFAGGSSFPASGQ
jgi:crotonobetaine/carnitine-CoA ligase